MLILPCNGDERTRDRVLTDDEIRTVWAAFEAEPPLLRVFCELRFLTAQRGGEVRTMRWAHVELSGKDARRIGWWTIPAEDSKNGLSHRVPLSAQAVNVLETLKPLTGGSSWVFPSPVRDAPIHEVKKVVQHVQLVTGPRP